MKRWTEIRTAYEVARLGTVSAAADSLGVHRATVIRHIDTLEGEMGHKLFQRHSKGYTPTELGLDLMKVGAATDEQFNQLIGRMKGANDELTGELVITSIESAAPLLMPIINSFRDENPAVIVRYLTDSRVFKLEYGEAHIAVRAGNKPNQPDNVVRHLLDIKVGLYAHKSYVERYGLPKDQSEFDQHYFVGFGDMQSGPPFFIWMHKNMPKNRIAFLGSSLRVAESAVRSGTGIGFMRGRQVENNPDFIEVIPANENWHVSLWLVTHVDLHRSAKVQAFLKHLKEQRSAIEQF